MHRFSLLSLKNVPQEIVIHEEKVPKRYVAYHFREDANQPTTPAVAFFRSVVHKPYNGYTSDKLLLKLPVLHLRGRALWHLTQVFLSFLRLLQKEPVVLLYFQLVLLRVPLLRAKFPYGYQELRPQLLQTDCARVCLVTFSLLVH